MGLCWSKNNNQNEIEIVKQSSYIIGENKKEKIENKKEINNEDEDEKKFEEKENKSKQIKLERLESHIDLNEKELEKIEQSIQIDSQNQVKLQHIFESIYDAAVKAQNNVQLNNLHHLFWLLPLNEQNIHVPRTIKIQIPTEDGYKHVNVPIITLMNQKSVCMSELKIKTEVGMQLISSTKSQNGCYNIFQKDYSLKLTPGKKTTEIEMTIKLEEPLEMVNRLITKLQLESI